MKNILVLLTLIFIFKFQTFSQSLILSIHSNPVKQDSVYTFYCSATEPNVEYVSVKNVGEEAIGVMVKKIIIDTVPGTLNTFCWGINCFEPTVYLTPFPITINIQAVNNSFYGDYTTYGIIGSSTIMYVFFNNDDVNDSAYVTIKYTLKDEGVDKYTGVNSKAIKNIYPSPADEQARINYKLTNDIKNPIMVVYNQTGQIIRNIQLNDSEGVLKLDTSVLPAGIYSCILSDKTQVYSLKKFQVIH
jgi:hypothetical protein